jgi:hypothetical protein
MSRPSHGRQEINHPSLVPPQAYKPDALPRYLQRSHPSGNGSIWRTLLLKLFLRGDGRVTRLVALSEISSSSSAIDMFARRLDSVERRLARGLSSCTNHAARDHSIHASQRGFYITSSKDMERLTLIKRNHEGPSTCRRGNLILSTRSSRRPSVERPSLRAMSSIMSGVDSYLNCVFDSCRRVVGCNMPCSSFLRRLVSGVDMLMSGGCEGRRVC